MWIQQNLVVNMLIAAGNNKYSMHLIMSLCLVVNALRGHNVSHFFSSVSRDQCVYLPGLARRMVDVPNWCRVQSGECHTRTWHLRASGNWEKHRLLNRRRNGRDMRSTCEETFSPQQSENVDALSVWCRASLVYKWCIMRMYVCTYVCSVNDGCKCFSYPVPCKCESR